MIKKPTCSHPIFQQDHFYDEVPERPDPKFVNTKQGSHFKVSTSSSTPSVSSDVAELKDMVRALILDKKNQTPAPAPVKAVEQSCINQPPTFQAPPYQAPAPAPPAPGVSKSDFDNYVKANDAVMQNMQNQMANITDLITKFVNSNTASTSGSGSLPSNTIANPKGDVKAITTRSGVSYNGPQISSLPKEMENEPGVTKDTVQPSTKNIQPLVVQTDDQIGEPVVASKTKPTLPYPSRANKEKLREKDDLLASKFMEIFRNLHFELSFADALLHMPKFAPMFRKLLNDKDKIIELTKTPVNENCSAIILKKLPEILGDPGRFLIPCDFPEMNECLALADLGASINLMPLSIWRELNLPALTKTRMILELADRTISTPTGIAEDVFRELRYKNYLLQYHESVNRVDVIDIACEEYVQEVLEISDSGNPTSPLDLMIDSRSPSFTPFGGSDFLMEEIDAFLEHDDSIHRCLTASLNSEGITVYLEELLSVINSDPNLSSSPICEINVPDKIKSSCEDPPDLELKDLPSHLEYAFLRKNSSQELNELRDHAYENSLIYKEKTKRIHDAKIKNRVFNVGDQVLLFNSRLKIFSGKLKSRWSGPFTVTQVFPYGTVELSQNSGPNFKDFPDCEDSRVRSFALHPQEFHILSFILGIQYPNLID
ncbi:reverse transcriptase domain-containing protein [Tanacetum coccineum]|uniref:Reverse transcriptase domain-containing protein n=1 Tax=Tanacetum coccineum TaxID=301880 RepID=A0ABQ5GI85_9ASTR